jgi:hypothetical protein
LLTIDLEVVVEDGLGLSDAVDAFEELARVVIEAMLELWEMMTSQDMVSQVSAVTLPR